MLQVRELGVDAPWAARLRYAYADGLLAAGRRDEAREWFARSAEADEDSATDAAERLLELDGVTIEGDEPDEDEEAIEDDLEDEEAIEDDLEDEDAIEDDLEEEQIVDVDAAEVKDLDDELDTDGVHGEEGPGTPA
jgi:hypothetical protein